MTHFKKTCIFLLALTVVSSSTLTACSWSKNKEEGKNPKTQETTTKVSEKNSQKDPSKKQDIIAHYTTDDNYSVSNSENTQNSKDIASNLNEVSQKNYNNVSSEADSQNRTYNNSTNQGDENNNSSPNIKDENTSKEPSNNKNNGSIETGTPKKNPSTENKPSIEDKHPSEDKNHDKPNTEDKSSSEDKDHEKPQIDDKDSVPKEDPSTELVAIADPNLKAVLNNALDKNRDPKADLTKADMEKITAIDSGFLPLAFTKESGDKHRGIRNLSGLEYAKNLETVKLSMNQIKDLTPIKDLKNIKYLEVFRNEISDLSPLRNLENLEHLDIYNNAGIADVEPISKLTKINFIDMHYCNRRTAKVNVEYLGTLTNLNYLSIDDDFVDDLSFVKNLKNLATLSCNNNYVTDLKDVQDLAADCFEDWSGDKFFNMYGQELKDRIKVEASSEGTVYKMKCPVTNVEHYVDKIYKTYDLTEGLPAISSESSDENNHVSLKYNKNTDELELTVDKNTTPEELNIKFRGVIEYGMYSLKLNFDITQAGATTEK